MVEEAEVNDTGVSAGWFEPNCLAPFGDARKLIKGIKRFLPASPPAWPLQVSSIQMRGRGVGVAYALVSGMIPVHIDTKGPDDRDTRIWQFVMEVRNRPMLLTARADGSETADRRSQAILGIADGVMPIHMAGLELKAGSALHFDIATHWHGVTQLPHGKSVDVAAPPLAVVIQVSGFGADQLGRALDQANSYIERDRAFWDRGL